MASAARLSGLTAKAVSGASWMFGSTILGRAVAVLGQIGIGWLLTPADFGVWALALSMSSAVMALRNGGTTQILVQRGAQFAAEARFFLRYSLLFNMVAAAIVSGLSIPYLLRHNAVGIALLGIGAAVPVSTLAMLYRAKLTIEARFGPLALINLGSASLWQVSVLILAWCGWGPASFACAPILQAIFETLAGRVAAGSLPKQSGSRPTSAYVALFRQSSWVMLSAAVLSLGTTGFYFAVGMLTDLSTVGVFYFGFQTVVNLSMPIYSGLESVLPSLLVKLIDEPSRQVAAFARALRTVIVTSIPLSIAFALAAPCVIHLLWHGKWDVAARSTQILAACVPAWLIIHCIRALLEAQGHWRLRFGLLALNGCGGIASAAVGACFGDVASIACAVAAFYVVLALGLLASLRLLGLTLRDLTRMSLQPLLLNGGALALTWLLRQQLFPANPIGTSEVLLPALFVIVVGVGNLAIFGQVWAELARGLAGAVRRRAASASV